MTSTLEAEKTFSLDEALKVCETLRAQGIPESVIQNWQKFADCDTPPLELLRQEFSLPVQAIAQVGRSADAEILLTLQDGSQVSLGSVSDIHAFRKVKERLFAENGLVLRSGLRKQWDGILKAIAQLKTVIEAPDTDRDLLMTVLSDIWRNSFRIGAEYTHGSTSLSLNLDDERDEDALVLTVETSEKGLKTPASRLIVRTTSIIRRLSLCEVAQVSRKVIARELCKIGFTAIRVNLAGKRIGIGARDQVRAWVSPAEFDRVLRGL
ncbi:MAG: hypothetical protein ACC613_06805 [Synergistales bacterium]